MKKLFYLKGFLYNCLSDSFSTMRTREEVSKMLAALGRKYDPAKFNVSYNALTDRFTITEIKGAKMKATSFTRREKRAAAKSKTKAAEIATNFPGEIWRPVNWGNGILTGYEVSNYGRVAKPEDGVRYLIVEWDYASNNMCQVHLSEDDGTQHCISVHHLVAEAFIPNPDKRSEVTHNNGDYKDNSVGNLAWV